MGIWKKGPNWYVDYYANGTRHREMVGPNRQQAVTVLAKRKVDIAENKFLDVQKRFETTLCEITEQFMEIHSKPNKRAWRDDATVIPRFHRFFGGTTLISNITRQQVEHYKADRATMVSQARTNRELALLKTIFNKAIQWEKAIQNPVKGVKLYKENNKRTRYLDKTEWAALLNVAPDWFQPILLIAFHTGMRRGEILNLRWQDVNLEGRLIHVREAKSGEGRFIPMNDILVRCLDVIERYPNCPYVLQVNGERVNPSGSLRTTFRACLKQAGIKEFRFHDLRHSFASHLVMAGVDIRTVGELMGHKSGLQMTMRYSHLSPQHKLEAVNRLSERIGGGGGRIADHADWSKRSVPLRERPEIQEMLP
jgi:integrase